MQIGCARVKLNERMRLGLLKDVVKHAAPTILALCGTASVTAHERDGIASDCLETVADGGRWHIRNRCDVKVHMAWCEEDDGGHCAWKGGPNLEPGGTHSTGHVSDVGCGSRWPAAAATSDTVACGEPLTRTQTRSYV